jgi:hypothetical protein
VTTHPGAELLGGDPAVPRTLLAGLDPGHPDEPAFRSEYFGPWVGPVRSGGQMTRFAAEASWARATPRLLAAIASSLRG